jgi:hypothetical protein
VSLLERAIVQAAQGQGSDGSILGRPPADDPRGRAVESMFAWVGALWEHHVQTGFKDLLARHQPVLDRLLDFLGRRERLEGLIGALEGFNEPATSADVYRTDFSAALNLSYLRALRRAADIYEVLGFEKESAWASKKGEALERLIDKYFWDPKGKVWRDGFDPVAGAAVEQTSVYANSLAVSLRLKPETHEALSRETILKSMAARRAKAVVPPPTLGGAATDALVEAGLRAEAIELIRTRWGGMLDRGASTFWEQWDGATGGRCSGASAAPPTRVLLEQVLGVTAVEPGWKRVRVSPVPGDLEFARGAVISPVGPIRVEWEKVGEDQLAVRVELPEGVEGEFAGPLGESRELESGASEFNT